MPSTLFRRTLPGLALAGALAGCMIGPGVRHVGAAREANGARITIVASPSPLVGELLEVRDEGMVIVNPRRVLLVPFTSLRTPLSVDRIVRLRPGVPPTAREREQLRHLSRFPQGIPPAYLQRLISDVGQDSLEVVR